MGQDQVKGILDRAAAVLATMFVHWMVTKGWLGESDAAQLAPAIVLLPSIAWGWWNNRPKALLQSAATVPGTTVIAAPELAKDTPEMNIISNVASKEVISASVIANTEPKVKP